MTRSRSLDGLTSAKQLDHASSYLERQSWPKNLQIWAEVHREEPSLNLVETEECGLCENSFHHQQNHSGEGKRSHIPLWWPQLFHTRYESGNTPQLKEITSRCKPGPYAALRMTKSSKSPGLDLFPGRVLILCAVQQLWEFSLSRSTVEAFHSYPHPRENLIMLLERLHMSVTNKHSGQQEEWSQTSNTHSTSIDVLSWLQDKKEEVTFIPKVTRIPEHLQSHVFCLHALD